MVVASKPVQKWRLRRGCGHRKPGYIYLSSKPASPEAPLEQNVICPPWKPWDKSPAEIGVTYQGMAILMRPDGSGIYDVYDWIGEHDYETFLHFFVEGKFYGFSRLIPKTAPFKLLTKDSRHFFIHPKASIKNVEKILEAREAAGLETCPVGNDIHDHPQVTFGIFDMCFAYLYEAVGDMPKDVKDRHHTVELPANRPKDEAPSCTFEALYIPKGVELEWEPGVILWTEIDGLEIPVDTIGDTHEKAMKILEESGTDLPYVVTED